MQTPIEFRIVGAVSSFVRVSTLTQVFVLAPILATLCYGSFLIVFALSMCLYWERRKENTADSRIIVGYSVVLFCLVTAHWFLFLWRCYEICINLDTGVATELAFADWDETKSFVRSALFVLQVWLADVFLIYRLYSISRGNIQYIAIPCITSVITMVCANFFLRSIAVKNILDPMSIARMYVWGGLTFMLSITDSIYCSGMIAYHIWKMRRNAQSNLRYGLFIFIQSTTVWITFMFVTLVLLFTNIYGWIIIIHSLNAVLGICFCSMIARLHLLIRTQPDAILDTDDHLAPERAV